MGPLEWIRVLFLGILEGITEWIPVSSTGHMVIADEIWKTKAPEIFTPEFVPVFYSVIRSGAAIAVATVFFNRLNPFSAQISREQKQNIRYLWMKLFTASVPALACGFFAEPFIKKYLAGWQTVAAMLIVFAVIFVAADAFCRKRGCTIAKLADISFGRAAAAGSFQVISFIPGVSRLGISITGALFCGCSRYAAVEFSYFLAIPMLLSECVFHIVRFLIKGQGINALQFVAMLAGMASAYLASVLTVRFMMHYVKRHNFNLFAFYRIILGIAVLILGFVFG